MGCTVGIVVVGAMDGDVVGFDDGVAAVGDVVGFVAFCTASTTAVYDALGASSTSNKKTFRSVYAVV